MNRHQQKGLSKQSKGAFKEVIGKATGDRLLQTEGKTQKQIGKLQRRFARILDSAPPGRDRCN
jgi:uncharacterized protein YjbJ (UPF0337 family)